MRVRIPLIIEESLIKKIDEIAGEKHRRAATIEKALTEFIAREALHWISSDEGTADVGAPTGTRV